MKFWSRGALVVGLLIAAMGCHHSKRVPVLQTQPPNREGGGDSNTRPQPLDNSGGDIRPIGGEGVNGRDLQPESMDGEGGPLQDIRFELDSAQLTPAAQQLLAAHAAWLKDHYRQTVVLEGHCDERGTVEYNLALGEQRAKTVYDYLIGLGIPASQMKTVSLGKERPLDSGHDEASWAKNRRVHCAVSGSR
jgi:peptidoglycan-associated lipoprotein